MRNPQHIQLAFDAGRVFSPAAPIDEAALFAGRIDQIRAVLDAVSQRGQHAIIFGERGVGKTSLANVLADFLGPSPGNESGSPNVLAPRVNCDSSDDFSSIWRKVFSEIHLARKIQSMGFGAPETTEAFDAGSHLSKQVTPDDIRKLLAQLTRGPLLILIIDEFDRVDNGTTSSLFADTIKTLSDHSIAATLVLVGVADSVDELVEEHLSVERSLLQIQMPRMSRDELHQIITNGLTRLGMDISASALEQISLLSQGLPHYTHLLGLHSARQAIDAGTKCVELHHLEAAINQALDQAQQTIRNAYHKATMSPRKGHLFRQVLLACALAPTDELGYFSPADVREPMSKIMGRPYDIPSFARHLKAFAGNQRGPIFQKSGPERRTRYRFINPLLQPYVTMQGLVSALVSQGTLLGLRTR